MFSFLSALVAPPYCEPNPRLSKASTSLPIGTTACTVLGTLTPMPPVIKNAITAPLVYWPLSFNARFRKRSHSKNIWLDFIQPPHI